ncbi:hypothetical protein P6A00_003625 [Vibrio parahaemolyticus]|uniref:hypothetical protein n=1 Tax=Vibrio parahaemolyticus TaxID=670 RepID=UPI00111ED315|nr:hypothetical protein [Vibrio parahaemolyticus]EGQ7799897.1 hypothetical protein [Vibrio parahaemolyticus]EGQ8112397.1 hypothetical protein [Vibrio parahaemolyticus]EGQ8200165.1 hypothetical protein [Vibrio parahaemolyticus]EGQ9149098.1 hypothetical protein [Vibrio parahaemolyticus]EGU0149653.1 hypothetical protein [Vibrio parahaemolyticus]
MKVRELISELYKLDQDTDVICLLLDDDAIDGYRKAYQLVDVTEQCGHKERLRVMKGGSLISATFREDLSGENVVLLRLTHDF